MSAIDVGQRSVIELEWGGKLFTSDETILSSVAKDRNFGPQSFITTNATCGTLVSMSTVVVELMNIVSEFWRTFIAFMDMENFKTILFVLEISHWHALAFNENLSLRLRLLQFSDEKNNLPNLLEQEVLSLEKLVLILFSLYAMDNDQIDYVFLQNWIERFAFSISLLIFLTFLLGCPSK